MIFKQAKVAYFHPGKTGGTSLEHALLAKHTTTKFRELKPTETYFDMMYGLDRENGIYLHHADLRYFQKKGIDLTGYSCLVSVRRPYERILSAFYYNGLNQKYKFENFIMNSLESYVAKNSELAKNHFCPQIYYYSHGFEIIKLEELEKRAKELDLPLTDKKHAKTKASVEYPKYLSAYTDKMKAKVQKVYELDFLVFGYDK